MGRIFRVEYIIPAGHEGDTCVYACADPACRTHFVLKTKYTGFNTYRYNDSENPDYHVHFHDSPVVNVEIGEQNENPTGDPPAVTRDVFCVGCRNKVGWKSIVLNPGGTGCNEERVLLFVKALVVFGGHGPQPQPTMNWAQAIPNQAQDPQPQPMMNSAEGIPNQGQDPQPQAVINEAEGIPNQGQ